MCCVSFKIFNTVTQMFFAVNYSITLCMCVLQKYAKHTITPIKMFKKKGADKNYLQSVTLPTLSLLYGNKIFKMIKTCIFIIIFLSLLDLRACDSIEIDCCT